MAPPPAHVTTIPNTWRPDRIPDGCVPDVVLSDPSRRSSSATLSSSRRYRSSGASSSARSIAFSASLASITARSRATSSR